MSHPNFNGKYVLEKNEKFEEYLAANGAPWLIRKMASKSTPTLLIKQEGEKFDLKLTSMVKKMENSFEVGQEFEETTPNGIIMKVKPYWEDQKLVLKYFPKEEGTAKEQTVVREIIGDTVVMTMYLDDLVAKRYFRKTE